MGLAQKMKDHSMISQYHRSDDKLTLFRTRSPSNKRRKLSDEELDSGDDEGRHDRGREDVDGDGLDEDTHKANANVMVTNIGRHPDPAPSDGEVCSFKKAETLMSNGC